MCPIVEDAADGDVHFENQRTQDPHNHIVFSLKSLPTPGNLKRITKGRHPSLRIPTQEQICSKGPTTASQEETMRVSRIQQDWVPATIDPIIFELEYECVPDMAEPIHGWSYWLEHPTNVNKCNWTSEMLQRLRLPPPRVARNCENI